MRIDCTLRQAHHGAMPRLKGNLEMERTYSIRLPLPCGAGKEGCLVAR